MKGLRIKFIITLIVLIVAIYFLYPTINLVIMGKDGRAENPEKAAELGKKAIKLGLDLQGGMHIVMEVDKKKLPEDLEENPIDEALEIIRNRVDQFGVAEPLIQKEGTDRIIVELPGIDNPQLAKELIQETALLEFKLLRKPSEVKKFLDDMDTLLAAHPEIMGGEEDTMELAEETEELGIEEVESGTPDSVVGEASSIFDETEETEKDTTELRRVTSPENIFEEEVDTSGSLAYPIEEEEEPAIKPFSGLVDIFEDGETFIVPKDNITDVQRILENPLAKKVVPKGAELHWDSELSTLRTGTQFKFLYLMNEKPELTGKYLSDASFALGSAADIRSANQPVVNLSFNKQGAKIFSQVTGANIKKKLAIVLDDKVHTAPTIQTKIREGKARITGIPSLDEAKRIAIVLRAGALPAPLEVIEERTVGPSLGEDSIKKGVFATLLGLILVAIFIIFYYKGAGIVANIALILNMIILMAAMAALHATLTLPGIAGIILTIGMAVDANVLIFERVREELATGKTVKAGIDTGYSRAFRTILDANLTTLITAIILYYFGTGPIRGFAITLSFGIVISMFTAIVVTRMIFDFYIFSFRPQKLSI
ncbi:protein translocase subunit SecD [bacterium]|nr:protein translocase subunit SecD [bacterium]